MKELTFVITSLLSYAKCQECRKQVGRKYSRLVCTVVCES